YMLLIVYYVIVCCLLCFFFFSSRRRHTISKRDWSSDVCSSDLFISARESPPNFSTVARASTRATIASATTPAAGTATTSERWWKIGRASGRERVEGAEGGGSIKKMRGDKRSKTTQHQLTLRTLD